MDFDKTEKMERRWIAETEKLFDSRTITVGTVATGVYIYMDPWTQHQLMNVVDKLRQYHKEIGPK